MWVGKKQNFIGSAGVVGSHSVLIFFFVFVCRLVNFHVAVFFLRLACNTQITLLGLFPLYSQIRGYQKSGCDSLL